MAMANIQTGQPSTYSFLVHSSSSSSHDAALDLPKQKRRRTSPGDHAVLEAAYLKNSKPDKNERAEIVSQVELGEKEVQIWFQNRRQNDRRKSKPLQPHELLAHFRNGGPAATTPGPDTPTEGQVVSESNNSATTPTSSVEVPRPSSRSSSIHELLNPPSSIGSASSKDTNGMSSQHAELVSTPPSSLEEPERLTKVQEPIPGTNQSEKLSSHNRKRSHDVMTQPVDVEVESGSNSVVLQVPPLAKRSSFVRLAMTVDGAVKVRTSDEATPSPPKQRAPPPNTSSRRSSGITRSQSAVEGGFEFKDINPPIRHVGGAGFGRSRDSRTWEFYCDRDASDALSTQIEAERNGSAIGAINLIRSHSQRAKTHTLSPNPMKQNKRRVPVEQNIAKPKLVRTQSSTGHLQNVDGTSDVQDSKAKRPRHVRSSSGDSDKENWAPGTRISQTPLRRMHPSAPRSSVLRGNDTRHQRASSGDNIGKEQEKGGMVKEKAKGDDLDCIQGLLSLSQGAWR